MCESKYWITYIVPDCWQWHENDFSFLCSLTHSYHIGRPSRLQVQRRKIRLLVAIYHGCQAKLITSIFNRIQNYIYSPKLSFFFQGNGDIIRGKWEWTPYMASRSIRMDHCKLATFPSSAPGVRRASAHILSEAACMLLCLNGQSFNIILAHIHTADTANLVPLRCSAGYLSYNSWVTRIPDQNNCAEIQAT